MKKIFFAALVAAAAIGGAVSSHETKDVRGLVSSYTYYCSMGFNYMCSSILEPIVYQDNYPASPVISFLKNTTNTNYEAILNR